MFLTTISKNIRFSKQFLFWHATCSIEEQLVYYGHLRVILVHTAAPIRLQFGQSVFYIGTPIGTTTKKTTQQSQS